VSIFKEKLAVLQNDRLLIYIASEESLKYNPFRKITKQFDCESMAILNSHVVFAKDSKVQLYNLMGELEREWVFESNLTFVKALGGPPKREHLYLDCKTAKSSRSLSTTVSQSSSTNLRQPFAAVILT
jgi:intraflagellar transport protein 122